MGYIQAKGFQTRYKPPGAVTTCPPGGHPDIGLKRPASGHQAHQGAYFKAASTKLLIYLSRVRIPEGAGKALVLAIVSAGVGAFFVY